MLIFFEVTKLSVTRKKQDKVEKFGKSLLLPIFLYNYTYTK